MKRSGSSTHIPIFRGECGRPRSRSTARNSRENSTSRNPSMDRLPPPQFKRSNSLTSFKKLGTTPRMTPIQNKPSNSGLRHLSTTPQSARKSPFSVKKERPIADKKWVAQQFSRIQAYLREHPNCDPNVVDRMKPPTINTFVYVANLLLKDIDRRIDVNMANYKEVVLAQMKALRFPGNVSSSLLKTVNAMHAWPQVISMFSWLVDLNVQLKTNNSALVVSSNKPRPVRMAQCIIGYLSKKYFMYNLEEDTTEVDQNFTSQLGEILNINLDKIKKLEEEIKVLDNNLEQQMEIIAEQMEKNTAKKSEIERLRNEIDTFYAQDAEREEQVLKELEEVREKVAILNENLKRTAHNIEELKRQLENQSCSYSDKMKILLHIDEMKHTINLKKEKIEKCKQIRDNYDYDLVEAKRTVENEIYRLNSSLMSMKLILPKVKSLQLPDKGFYTSEFREEIARVSQALETFEVQMTAELIDINKKLLKTTESISDFENLISAQQADVEKPKNKIDELHLILETWNNKIEKITQDAETFKKEKLKKIEELDKTGLEIPSLEQELCNLQKEKLKMEKNLDELQAKCIEFFMELRGMIFENLEEMNKIHISVLEKFAKSVHKIRDTEAEILAELHEKLDKFKVQL